MKQQLLGKKDDDYAFKFEGEENSPKKEEKKNEDFEIFDDENENKKEKRKEPNSGVLNQNI